ncbi:hypothetical protein ABZ922_44835 [Streptomyces shenzhenensis]|uniref:hypothetical protein n=1 Tax=Streptomyces shenzhenensis TaxID=943815 RepID=UPI0033DF3156
MTVEVCTNPIQLALWAGKGQAVVFATYAWLRTREAAANVDEFGFWLKFRDLPTLSHSS